MIRLLFFCLLLCTGIADVFAQRVRTTHHFAQPTAAELRSAVAAIKADSRWPGRVEWIWMGFRDQPKDSLLGRTQGDGPRAVQAVLYDPQALTTYEFSVDLRTMKVVEVLMRNDVHPALTQQDLRRADSIVRAHQGWRDAVVRRGADTNQVANALHATGSPISGFRQRLAYTTTYRSANDKPRYDAPLEGLRCLVDITNNRVMLLNDTPPDTTAPLQNALPAANGRQKTQLSKRTGRAPWTMQNGRIRWNGWTFSVVMTPREGLVLYDVRFDDGRGERPVAWRMAISEWFTTTSDTTPNRNWQHEYLAGEYGLGTLAQRMQAGVDVPAYAQMLDMASVDANGTVFDVRGVGAVYTRDAQQPLLPSGSHARNAHAYDASELVVTSTAAVRGAAYAVHYVLRTDGSVLIELGVRNVPSPTPAKTSVAGMPADAVATSPYDIAIACLRLDLDVGGQQNALYEVDRALTTTPSNAGMITYDVFELRAENEAKRRADVNIPTKTDRSWMVAPTTRDTVQTNAYMIDLARPPALSREQLMPRRTRSQFAQHDVWTTVYNPAELFAAGIYPNQAVAADGLAAYTIPNQALHGRDLVTWVTVPVVVPTSRQLPYEPGMARSRVMIYPVVAGSAGQ